MVIVETPDKWQCDTCKTIFSLEMIFKKGGINYECPGRGGNEVVQNLSYEWYTNSAIDLFCPTNSHYQHCFFCKNGKINPVKEWEFPHEIWHYIYSLKFKKDANIRRQLKKEIEVFEFDQSRKIKEFRDIFSIGVCSWSDKEIIYFLKDSDVRLIDLIQCKKDK